MFFSLESSIASELPSADQIVNIISALISMDALHVQELLDHLVLQDNPIAAAQFSGSGAHWAGDTGAVGFGHGDLAEGGFVPLVEGRDTVAEEDHRVYVWEHPCKFLLRSLERSHRLTELSSLKRVGMSCFISTSS